MVFEVALICISATEPIGIFAVAVVVEEYAMPTGIASSGIVAIVVQLVEKPLEFTSLPCKQTN